MDQFHSNLLLLQCQRLKTQPLPFDCAIRVFASNDFCSESKEHLLFVHNQIISNKSTPLREQLDQQNSIALTRFLLQLNSNEEENFVKGLASSGALNNSLKEIKLDLSALQNGLESFKQFLIYLYGDQSAAIANKGIILDQLLLLSKLFAVPELEMTMRSATILGLLGIGGGKQQQQIENINCNLTASSSNNGFNNSAASLTKNNETLAAAYLQVQQSLLFANQSSSNTFLQASVNSSELQSSIASVNNERIKQPFASITKRSDSDNDNNNIGEDSQQQQNNQNLFETQHLRMNRRESNTSSGSSSIQSSIGNDNNSSISINEASGGGGSSIGDMLLPPNDKEGWCRNKKYIQIVKTGYRCLLCNKVYGRYNSVSYHVTIYHRNPPIRCEEQGCQFTTREARYIHFHKYYRHQIALPDSIDLASRKCPLIGCKHVSKSPAMLEKHMQRHVADCLKEGGSSSSIYICRMPIIIKSIIKKDDDENTMMMDSLENNDPEIINTLNIVKKTMKERRNTYSGGGCSGSTIGGGGQCLYKANSRELMYAHLLNCHSASNTDASTLAADIEKRSEEDDDEETRLLGGGKMSSASAPSTPPTSSSQLSSPLLSRFPCNECNYRGRTLTSLTNHKLQKHCQVQKQQHKQKNIIKPPHLPPTKCSSFMLPFNPSLFNYGGTTGGGIFGAGGFSLPGSPLSPQNVSSSSLGLGNNSIYPNNGVGTSFMPSSTTFFQGGSNNTDLNNTQNLLSQLLAAQKIASVIFSLNNNNSASASPPQSTSSANASPTTIITTTNSVLSSSPPIQNNNK